MQAKESDGAIMIKKNKLTTNILGTNYSIEVVNQKKMQDIAESSESFFQGLCDYQDKVIYIDEDVARDEYLFNTTLRHEIIHSYFYESGLNTQCDFARIEENVDWIALQFPKIMKNIIELGLEK